MLKEINEREVTAPMSNTWGWIRVAQRLMIFTGALGAVLMVAGIVGFFLNHQPSMTILGTVTVSGFAVFLISGIVFWFIDLAQHLGALLISHDHHPGK